jgi:Transposase zinc-binding domain/Putative transposase
MTTITAIFNAFAPEYLERYPNLPGSHQKTLSAIQNCRTGHYGHSLSECQSCAPQHRVHHSGGNRHCPQCQHHKTQHWLHHQLAKHLPGPHSLLTCTVPEALRPCIRSPQRIAYSALCTASATALQRLAQEERFSGTNLPGFPGIRHPWGRELQYHPHIHYLVPGGGLSKGRTTWLPSRATFFVPVTALSPLSRALFKEDMSQAGLLEDIDPHVWTIPWNVHSQAKPHGHTSCTYLAP